METVYKDEELLDLVYGNYYIYDALATRFEIYEQDYKLCIDVYFTSLNRKLRKEQQLKVHLVGVMEYGFYFSNKHTFYQIETYKFFKTDKGYYLSLDPYEGEQEISEEDQDFIWCESVVGYLTTLP